MQRGALSAGFECGGEILHLTFAALNVSAAVAVQSFST